MTTEEFAPVLAATGGSDVATSPAQVATVLRALVAAGIAVDPDLPATEYVQYADGGDVFTAAQAAHLDAYVDSAHDVCRAAGADIYGLALAALRERLA
jgi:hypothetical protein